MTFVVDVLSALLLLAGCFFFTSGTIGLIRFPDVRSQLHALTKADNLGLGLILLGVALLSGSWSIAGVLLVTWLLALGAASVSAQVIAGRQVELNHTALRDDVEPAPTVDVAPTSENSAGTSAENRAER